MVFAIHWHESSTGVPHPESPSHLPPLPIPLGHPSAPAPSTLYHALNLDWRFISHMIFYMFQCHSPKSSHPCPLPQSPKDCSIHLCLFCCLAYRVIVTIFLMIHYTLLALFLSFIWLFISCEHDTLGHNFMSFAWILRMSFLYLYCLYGEQHPS